METKFYILLSLKTMAGYFNYGHYFIGNNRKAADTLFNSFKGSVDIDDPALLHVDLMETVDELPVNIRTICCSLDELGCNVKLIAKEIFKQQNLKDL